MRARRLHPFARHTPRATVLVLWTGYPPGPHVVRSLSRAGFRCIGAHPVGRGGVSLSIPRPFRYPPPSTSPDAFLSRVDALCRREGVDAIVPLDEDIVRLLAERGDELAPTAVVGPDRNQYAALCDKGALTETARSADVDVPTAVEVHSNTPDGPWPDLPSIVKPATSTTSGATVKMVNSADERDTYLSELASSGYSALVQECIQGPRRMVQSVRGRGTFEFVTYRILAEWPRRAGVACHGRPEATPPQLSSAVQRLLGAVDYVGPSGISFLERDGRYYVHDVNLRFGGSMGVSLHAGFDWPRRTLETVLGLQGEPFSGAWRPGQWLRLDCELAALFESFSGEVSKDERARVMRRIATVAVAPRGRLDPSPLDPLGVWPFVAKSAARAGARAARRRLAA